MRYVGIHAAKTRLSNSIDEVEQARRHQAIAELREMARKRGLRVAQEEIKSWVEDGRH